MNRLLKTALISVFALAGLAKAETLTQVQYNVIVKDADGKTIESRSMTGVIGNMMTSQNIQHIPIQCDRKTPTGGFESIKADYADGLAIMLLPLELSGGEVSVAVSTVDSSADLKRRHSAQGCALPVGVRNMTATDEVIRQSVGQSRVINIGAGKTAEVTLSSLQQFEARL